MRAFEELREWVATADLCVCPIDWPALELAGIVWDLCSDGTSRPDPALRGEVVGHVDAGGPGEPEALMPMMRLESLVSALIGLTREARDESDNREFTKFLVANLDELA